MHFFNDSKEQEELEKYIEFKIVIRAPEKTFLQAFSCHTSKSQSQLLNFNKRSKSRRMRMRNEKKFTYLFQML